MEDETRDDLLTRLAPSGAENFVTEVLCWLLERRGLGERFLDRLSRAGGSAVPDVGAGPGWTTQEMYRGFGQVAFWERRSCLRPLCGVSAPYTESMAIEDLSAEVERTLVVYDTLIEGTAGRTRPMLDRHGPVEALRRLAETGGLRRGFKALQDAGLLGESFEQLVVKHAELFAADTVAAAQWQPRPPESADVRYPMRDSMKGSNGER